MWRVRLGFNSENVVTLGASVKNVKPLRAGCFWMDHQVIRATRWRSWLRYCAQVGRSQVRFQMVSLEFFVDIILPAALWPWELTHPLTEMSTRNIS